MLTTLASADAVTWLSILVKALVYGSTLVAVGSVMMLSFLSELSDDGRAFLRRTTVGSAISAGLFSALRLPVGASFLVGGTWDGALDPIILGMVVESPLGTSVGLRLVGLTLTLCVILRSSTGRILAVMGALLASASFAFRGHALGEPQIILAALITAHILCLAFWVGGLAPLARSARLDPSKQVGALAHEFGALAFWVVCALVVVGASTLTLLGTATPDVLITAYGQFFAIKLGLFVGVLSLASFNKLFLTPQLLSSAPRTRTHLRMTVGLEAVVLTSILFVTATLTTVSSPPSTERSETTSNFKSHFVLTPYFYEGAS